MKVKQRYVGGGLPFVVFHISAFGEEGGHGGLERQDCEFGLSLLFWFAQLQAVHKHAQCMLSPFLHRREPPSMPRRKFYFVLMLPPMALARLGTEMWPLSQKMKSAGVKASTTATEQGKDNNPCFCANQGVPARWVFLTSTFCLYWSCWGASGG